MPTGKRLTQTSTKTDGTSEDAWYGYNASSNLAGHTGSFYSVMYSRTLGCW